MAHVRVAQLSHHAAGNLRDFERMCEARSVKVTVTEIQDLGLALKAPE
jgi:hypothetical protein